MRVLLKSKDRELLFGGNLRKYTSINILSVKINTSLRTIRNWSNGTTTIPFEIYKKLCGNIDISTNHFQCTILEDYWNNKKAGKAGGEKRIKQYGNFGTHKSRSKGGLASIQSQSNLQNKEKTGFKTAKKFTRPKKNEKFAEFLGILFGDGHISKYQVSIATNSITDINHAHFVMKLIFSLFSVTAKIKKKPNKNAVEMIVSSVNLVCYLQSEGMPLGNKIKGNIHIPLWIMEKEKFQKAFLRGLFDTDGCVYLDSHSYKHKNYRHIGWTITSYADKLLKDTTRSLALLGFEPTQQPSQKSVYIRKQHQIKRYFNEIGSHNSKHINRYQEFIGKVA
jgi:intein/homing endonuclease